MQFFFRCLMLLSIVVTTFGAGRGYCRQDIVWLAGTSIASEARVPMVPGAEFASICTTAPHPILGHLSICAPSWSTNTGRAVALVPLNAATALVVDQREWRSLYSKEAETIRPIASITKLMNAMVVLDAGSPLDEVIPITTDDIDRLKGSSSRLVTGIQLRRGQLLGNH